MTQTRHDRLMDYLTPRRTASVGNLATYLDCGFQDLVPIIQQLKSEGRLRLSASRCAGGCSTCQSCPSAPGAPPAITEQTIAISLEKRKPDQ